ncbi:MAG: F0F1 ATP synthase subunit B [Lachnospiraceae bacterium]|jgi:F-type H+-transporting ATPase subunit b
MQVQELVGIIPWTFVAQICNLFIQMYLIKRFLFKPVHEILEKRRAATDAEIIQAEETKAKAEAIRAEYERNMQDARQKANEILDSARNTAAIQSEKILKEAQDQTFAMKNKAEKEIAQEKKKAVNEVKGEIGDMAVEIAGKVIEREINEKDHEKLIDEFISNVGEVS